MLAMGQETCSYQTLIWFDYYVIQNGYPHQSFYDPHYNKYDYASINGRVRPIDINLHKSTSLILFNPATCTTFWIACGLVHLARNKLLIKLLWLALLGYLSFNQLITLIKRNHAHVNPLWQRSTVVLPSDGKVRWRTDTSLNMIWFLIQQLLEPFG